MRPLVAFAYSGESTASMQYSMKHFSYLPLTEYRQPISAYNSHTFQKILHDVVAMALLQTQQSTVYLSSMGMRYGELNSPATEQQCDAVRLKAFKSMRSLLSPFSTIHGNSKWLTESIRWIYINRKKKPLYWSESQITNDADGQPIYPCIL